MKKILLIFLILILLSPILSGGDFNDKGWISGWKFFPLQVDVSLVKSKKLADESADTIFSFGLFTLQQKSAILSISFVANTLQNNYGLQINPLLMGTVTDNNYGISFGLENYCKNCYGMQIGILNHSWGGWEIVKEKELLQILGMNVADKVYLGIMNVTDQVQIGLLNLSPRGAFFQLGLLNYNPRSYIPWMPFINFNMGRKIKIKTAE